MNVEVALADDQSAGGSLTDKIFSGKGGSSTCMRLPYWWQVSLWQQPGFPQVRLKHSAATLAVQDLAKPIGRIVVATGSVTLERSM